MWAFQTRKLEKEGKTIWSPCSLTLFAQHPQSTGLNRATTNFRKNTKKNVQVMKPATKLPQKHWSALGKG